MTGRETSASDPSVRLLDEAGVPGSPALTRALEGIGVLGAGPAPEVSAELAQLMADGGRAPAGRRNKRRITFIGGALAVSMGVGMSGVAAGPFPLQEGLDDASGARLAARESADRVRDLPEPPVSSKGSADTSSPEKAGGSSVGAAAAPGAVPPAASVIEEQTGRYAPLPDDTRAAAAAGSQAAVLPPQPDASSTPSREGTSGRGTPGARVLPGTPSQAVTPLPSQRDPAAQKDTSTVDQGAGGSGAGGSSAQPVPRPSTPADSASGLRAPVDRGVEVDPGLRGPIDGTAERWVSGPSGDGGFAAVGRDRALGGAAQGASAGASPQDRTTTRLHAPLWASLNSVSDEGMDLGGAVAVEEHYGMFALLLSSIVIDAGEWVPDDALPVVPQDAPGIPDPSAVDPNTVDPAAVHPGRLDPAAGPVTRVPEAAPGNIAMPGTVQPTAESEIPAGPSIDRLGAPSSPAVPAPREVPGAEPLDGPAPLDSSEGAFVGSPSDQHAIDADPEPTVGPPDAEPDPEVDLVDTGADVTPTDAG